MSEHLKQKKSAGARPLRMRGAAWFLAIGWLGVLAASLFYNWNTVQDSILQHARIEARAAFEKDVAYRRWATSHGGVYVPTTTNTPPNPYLAHLPDRDVTTAGGKALTLVNPAYMTRQVHELFREQYGLRGHITSLQPLRLANAADSWETNALTALQNGKVEVTSVEVLDGQSYMRLMRPLVIEPGCLKCHRDQNYKVGEIGGGISVSVPMTPYRAIAQAQMLPITLAHLGLAIAGLAGVFWVQYRQEKNVAEQLAKEEQFRQQIHEGMEKRLLALTQPVDAADGIQFDELFNREEIQKLQDHFAQATGVASIITFPDGRPITRPSNFCRLCKDIIRRTDCGLQHCHRSDAVLGRHNPEGPIIQPCLSGGLWDAGASITVGGRHIANWLIGQVRNEAQDENAMRRYAREIGANEAEFMAAFAEVPCMPLEQFRAVAQTLFTLAQQLSATAYQNVQQARFIAEAQKAKLALQESEERYRLLAENASDVIWVADVETQKFTYVSPSVLRMRGFQPEETVGLEVAAVVTPESYQRLLSTLPERRARFQKGEDASYTDEVQQPCKDGPTIWTESVSRFRVNAKTGRLEMYGITRDISTRKRVEEQLRRAQADLEKAQAFGHVGSWSCPAQETGELKWSVECCRIFGVGPDGFDGRMETFWRQVHPEDIAIVRAASEAALAGKQPYELEHRIVRSDGVVRWVHQQAELERDAQGRPLRMIGIIQDITERRLAEDTLRESEERFRTAIEGAPDAIYIEIDQRFTYLNQAALRVFGAAGPDQLIGLPVLDRFHPDFHEQIKERIRRLVEERQPVPLVEERCVRLDGSYFDAEVTAVPFVFKGKNGVLVFLRDVSARKRLEAQFRQAQKMEAVGQLAGGIAHDFNNILAAQLMQLNLLQENPHLDQETHRSLTELEKGTNRAANLVRQLLLFSRQSVKQTKALDLNELIGDLLKMLRRLLGEHIEVEWCAGPGLPRVEADPGMIEQVVMNLCVNARDAMPKGGRLMIVTTVGQGNGEKNGTNGEANSGPHVCLSVSDTGCGIDEATLQHIFEPFFTTKEVGKGTGLGLATVHGIVQQHNGRIEVQSVVGQGSTFRILLPAIQNNQPDTGKAIKTTAPAGTEVILVVEDELAVRNIVARSLRRHGYQVLEAASGKAALGVWQSHREEISLLFTDMVMPDGMSGLDLADQLRADKLGLPVIISSGYSNEFSQDGTLPGACVTYLPKPYDLNILARVVRNCLDGRCESGARGGS